MPYATETDLLERMGEHEMRQVADHTRSGTADTEVVEAALEDADNLIDGYVAAKYATPLPSVPPLVRSWAVSIARYVLHRNGAPDHVEQDYKDGHLDRQRDNRRRQFRQLQRRYLGCRARRRGSRHDPRRR
ncbi:gp436 family protein [Paracoccus spongiarum]|uniref:DUF1320 domain-containing protein n=1 Tax=Paracoccus spongiarum TaxID=3064387 RepID=A0ABT9JFT6_9RHOB|nr:DUF1320 domain-containing protein [Paracoccus sp. 2205BS29-5]MDP5307921.1 DUF1320 domain-containing protein [Paracoccus sp. 2205BS29-5]